MEHSAVLSPPCACLSVKKAGGFRVEWEIARELPAAPMSRVSRAAECGMNLAPSPRRAGRGAAAASAGSPSSSPSGATAPPRSFFMSSSLHRRRPRQGAHARVSTPAARRAHGTLTRAPTRSHSAQPDTHHEDTRDVALSSTSICGLALFLPRCTIASTRHRTCFWRGQSLFPP